MSDLCELTARFTLAGHKGRLGETGKWCEEMNGECTKWKEGKLFLVQRIVEVEYGHQLLHFHDPLNCAKRCPNFRNIFYSFCYFPSVFRAEISTRGGFSAWVLCLDFEKIQHLQNNELLLAWVKTTWPSAMTEYRLARPKTWPARLEFSSDVAD